MSVTEAKLNDGFTASMLHSALPLLIWAAHFFLSYASAEVACALHLQRFTLGGVAAPGIWLWLITAVAIAALLVLTLTNFAHGRVEASDTLAAVRIGVSVLALVSVLWSAVPIAFVVGSNVCSAAR